MDTKQNNNNVGIRNTGHFNSGDCNTGNRNFGNRNFGDCNTGNCNIGNCNIGNRNSGNRNSGNWNTGNDNFGDFNTGNGNFGVFNTGDFNGTNCAYCFDEIEPTISFFNQPSTWTLSQWRESTACGILHCLCARPVEWFALQDMTEAEKKKYPECETLKGWLKPLNREEQTAQTVEKWKALSDEKKRLVMSIPNFDKEIFKQITGIDVDS